MTPGPRGLPRTLTALAVLAAVLVLPVATAAGEGPLCDGEVATLVIAEAGLVTKGTDGRDVIVGTDGNDVIYGMGGDDLICAGAGVDVVLGGRGNDVIYGEAGDDLIFGGPGNDTLFGGEGNDQVWGEAGRDVIYGEAGTDVLYGGGGPDTLYGGDGDDKLYGEAGRDRLYGGDGDDELQGGSEDDRLYGDAGNDYLWGDAGDDTLIGGAGDDLLQGGPGADNLQGRGGFDEMWGGECGQLAGVVNCREVPTGRPDGDPTVDPGDTYIGGPGVDACDKGPGWPDGCDTRRGERPGSPWDPTAAGEWFEVIDQAFMERALILAEAGKQEIADALLVEVPHAQQIAACESMGDIFQMTASSPTGATVDGLFQHKSIYWAGRAADAGYAGASVFDPLANARVAAWMVAVDIEYYWDDLNRISDRLAWYDWACDELLIGHDPNLWQY
jgi:Ca2+-binding RTX toxin-like protein